MEYQRKSHERMTPEARKDLLLKAALAVAKSDGIKAVTRVAVARKADVSDGLVNRYFDGREGLRKAVVALAKAQKIKSVLTSAAEAGYPV